MSLRGDSLKSVMAVEAPAEGTWIYLGKRFGIILKQRQQLLAELAKWF